MKSIKPGRGPSMMGGVMSIAMGVFGVIWTLLAMKMGGGLFGLFGVVFIIVAIVQAVYHFRNATAKDRFSVVDITDSSEEGDPLQQRFGREAAAEEEDPLSPGQCAFCPYCGVALLEDFDFCPKCGSKLPE